MTTLLQSLFYLWLVVSVLLVTMWFLRRQDRMRDTPEPDTLLPGFDGPVFEESPPIEGSPSSTKDDVEPEPAEADSVEDEDEDEDDAVDAATADADQADSDGEGETGPEGSDNSDEADDPGAADGSDDSDGSGDSDHVDDSDESDRADNPDDDSADSNDSDHADDPAGADDTSDTDNTADSAEKAVAATEAVRGNAGSVEHEPDEPDVATIDALLDGIDLPFDLTPIEPVDEDPDRYAVFLSPHQDPAQVGTAFADQLTELGYEIEPAGFDEAVARRNGDVLTMRIGANAGPEDDEGRRFPMASETDVAIEVWTGTGPPPKQST